MTTHALDESRESCDDARVRTLVLALPLLLAHLACERAAAPPPSQSAAAAPADRDAALFGRWHDAMARQVESDARAGAAQIFHDREEARRFLASLTPAGFRPRPEFFADLTRDAGDLADLALRMAAYAQSHPEEIERRTSAFVTRLEPLLRPLTANIERQFPSRWGSDPAAALAEATRRGRATVLLFTAEWDMASKMVERAFADPAVEQALGASFVAARVDMSDGDATARPYAVTGTPTILVFDRSGREIARRNSRIDVPELLELLAGAATP